MVTGEIFNSIFTPHCGEILFSAPHGAMIPLLHCILAIHHDEEFLKIEL